MRYHFPGDDHQGERGSSACWTLDPGFLLLPLEAPREEALMVVDSESLKDRHSAQSSRLDPVPAEGQTALM